MKSTATVAYAVAWRILHNVFTNPSLMMPALLFPLIFFLGFAGGLSRVNDVPGFDYDPGYETFQFGFVLLQTAALGGVFTGFGIARDFERGFVRRLLLAAPRRSGCCSTLRAWKYRASLSSRRTFPSRFAAHRRLQRREVAAHLCGHEAASFLEELVVRGKPSDDAAGREVHEIEPRDEPHLQPGVVVEPRPEVAPQE